MTNADPSRRIPAAVSTLLRFFFAATFGVTGFAVGREFDLHVIALHLADGRWQTASRFLVPVIGAVLFVLISPFAQRLFESELVVLEEASEYLSASEIAFGTAGLCVGLVLAILARFVVAGFVSLAGEAGDAIGLLFTALLCSATTYVGLRIGARERRGILVRGGGAREVENVLDTSAIIDGRILEIHRVGFLDGVLIVPRFVLVELQAIADSNDPARRSRGRRGLELLNELREIAKVVILEVADGSDLEVDARLVITAKTRGAKLVTSDYNLNRVATVEGVSVLNVNELAQAMRPVLQAGQELSIAITRDGREPHQGIGYLEDGTMIVVENGRAHRGEDIPVTVTSVIQTAAGRMIFAKIR